MTKKLTKPYTLKEIAENLKKLKKKQLSRKNSFEEINFISTDSRDSLDSQSLFICLKGEKFDGSDFVLHAFEKGCRNFIVNFDEQQKVLQIFKKKYQEKNQQQNQKKISQINFFFVEDSLISYGDLAKNYLKKWQGTKIAITGSAGKTSTKFYLTYFLKSQTNVFTSEKNYNNAIGIPKCIFQIDKNYPFYIFEMGMNHSNEISYLSKIVEPEITLITTVLAAHIGYFKNEQEIAKAKAEIFDGQNSCGVAFLPKKNKHLNFLISKTSHLKKVYLFDQQDFEMSISLKDFIFETKVIFDLKSDTKNNLEKSIKKFEIIFQKFDPFTVANLAPALAVFSFLQNSLPNFNSDVFQKSLKNIPDIQRRCSEINFNPKIIDDSYNANFDSLVFVVKELLKTVKNNVFIILGDVLELGEKSQYYHTQMAKEFNLVFEKNKNDNKNEKQKYNSHFCFYGRNMLYCYQNLGYDKKEYFETKEELCSFLQENFSKDTIFFFKASNGMGFVETIEKLKNTKSLEK